MTKTFKKVMTFLLGLTMLGGAVGGAVLANPAGGGLELKAAEETVVFDFPSMGMANQENLGTRAIGDITVVGAVYQNTNKLEPKYYTKGTAVRMYAKNSITITSTGGPITLVDLERTSGTWANVSLVDTPDATLGTDQITSDGTNSITFTFNASSGNISFRTISVTTVSEDITLDDLFVVGEESFTTFDVLTAGDFSLDGTKSDGTEVTFEDVTAQIGHDTELRDVEWGVTKPLVTDTVIRFTSTIPNSTGGYDTFDVNITVTEPTVASIAISGDMTTKSYIPGDSWDNSGLVVTGTFDVGGTADLTNEVQWTYSPSAPALGVEQVIVTAKYGEASASTTINGIQVFDYVKDTITVEDTGVTGAGNYTGFEGVQGTTAVYAGDIARNNANSSGQYAIQMNNSATRGIWSTTSGGTIRGIEVEWADNTNTSRTLRVYGSNSDASTTSGMTQIGSLGYGETFLMFDAEHNYTQVHINASGAAYLLSVSFIWEPLPDAELESITLGGTLTNTTYLSTDTAWNAEGLTLTLNYSDGNTFTLTSGLNLTWNPASPSETTTGDTTVTVCATHGGLTSNELTLDVYVEVGPTYILDVVDESTSLEADTSSGSFVTDGGVDWHYYTTGGTYINREGSANGRGLQFGTGKAPCSEVVLYSDVFAASTGETLINRVIVTAATAADGNNKVTLTVKVNGEEVGNTLLTSSNATYTFDLDTPMYGSVELVYSNPANSAVYFRGIDVFADTHETMTAEVVAAVNGLLDFRTCEIDATSVEFGTWLDANKTIIEENREVLTNLVAHDYESMDITYTGNKTSIVNVLAKYDACVARYETANGALAPTIFGNEDTTIAVVVVIITLAAITALVGFYYYDKRRRVNK